MALSELQAVFSDLTLSRSSIDELEAMAAGTGPSGRFALDHADRSLLATIDWSAARAGGGPVSLQPRGGAVRARRGPVSLQPRGGAVRARRGPVSLQPRGGAVRARRGSVSLQPRGGAVRARRGPVSLQPRGGAVGA